MILVEHFSPLCERKVEPAPAVSEEGGTQKTERERERDLIASKETFNRIQRLFMFIKDNVIIFNSDILIEENDI